MPGFREGFPSEDAANFKAESPESDLEKRYGQAKTELIKRLKDELLSRKDVVVHLLGLGEVGEGVDLFDDVTIPEEYKNKSAKRWKFEPKNGIADDEIWVRLVQEGMPIKGSDGKIIGNADNFALQKVLDVARVPGVHEIAISMIEKLSAESDVKNKLKADIEKKAIYR